MEVWGEPRQTKTYRELHTFVLLARVEQMWFKIPAGTVNQIMSSLGNIKVFVSLVCGVIPPSCFVLLALQLRLNEDEVVDVLVRGR